METFGDLGPNSVLETVHEGLQEQTVLISSQLCSHLHVTLRSLKSAKERYLYMEICKNQKLG